MHTFVYVFPSFQSWTQKYLKMWSVLDSSWVRANNGYSLGYNVTEAMKNKQGFLLNLTCHMQPAYLDSSRSHYLWKMNKQQPLWAQPSIQKRKMVEEDKMMIFPTLLRRSHEAKVHTLAAGSRSWIWESYLVLLPFSQPFSILLSIPTKFSAFWSLDLH